MKWKILLGSWKTLPGGNKIMKIEKGKEQVVLLENEVSSETLREKTEKLEKEKQDTPLAKRKAWKQKKLK